MRLPRRVWLFAKDYWSEFGCAWSIARYRDCERNGGHRWQPPQDDPVLGRCRICARCGVGEPIYRTSGTGTTVSSATINVSYP